MKETAQPAMADTCPGEGDDAEFLGIETRIYHGIRGRVVLTVEAANPAQTRLLGRICGTAIEAAFFRMFRDRLTRE